MKRLLALIVILVIAALIIVGLNGLCGSRADALACLRDVAIIVLVAETFAVTLLLALIVLLFARLTAAIQNEITPVIRSAKRTVDTVEGTTTFVSNTFVAPLINLAGFGAGVRGALGALLTRRKK